MSTSTHHVYGIISKGANLDQGTGIKEVTRKEKGEYEIMFKETFASSPAILATAIHAEESERKVLNVVVDKETFTKDEYKSGRKGAVVLIQTPDGEPNDNKFSFLAVGQR